MSTEEGRRIIEDAIEEHAPVAIFALFSGGHDSLTATHFAADVLGDRLTGVAHIDTGIGIPETQQFVVDVCQQFGWPLKMYRAAENVQADGTPDPMIYDDIVVKHGFPGPGAHRTMYSKLKQRQVRRLVRDHKTQRSDRVMLITGVRREESKRRMGTTEEVQTDGAQVWIAPMLYFTGSSQAEYMREHALPRNPVKDKLCMSGECLCGAFAKKGELKEIEFWYPEVGRRIRELEQRVQAAGHLTGWGRGEFQGLPEEEEESGGMELCVACENIPDWLE